MAKGLWFRNVDLHVHTPASDCFLDKSVMPETIVQQAMDVGLDAIAVTDHNTALWVDKIKEAAKGTNLVVFPGVEISVNPGVHILALFHENATSSHVTDLLSKLGLDTDSRGNPEAIVTTFGIQQVVNIIEENHALPILAHIDDKKGAWTELHDSGQTFIQLWNSGKFAAVEIVGEKLPNELYQSPFIYKPAYYWASDNPHPENSTKHSEKGIGSRFSRLKLEDPISWEGLWQCFHDPQTRIKRGIMEEVKVKHPIIKKISIKGGFLSGLDIELTPNLNTVIGGRGTGKSSLLELIRHAFDIESKTEANERQTREIIEYIFPAGSTICVEFNLADGTQYRVERRSKQPPVVFRSGTDENVAVKAGELFPLHVYGQKEIYEISKNPAFQLNLLDNYIIDDLKPLNEEEKEILRQLRDNAADILRLDEDIDSSTEWLDRLEAIKEELHRMENKGFVSTIQTKKLYDQEHHFLDQMQDQVGNLLADITNYPSDHRLNVDYLSQSAEQLPNSEIFEKLINLLNEINTDLKVNLIGLREKIVKIWSEGKEYRDKWIASFEFQEKTYQDLLGEFQGSGDADRYIQLQRRKLELEERDRDVKRHKTQVEILRQNRLNLLALLRKIRRDKYEIRLKKANELTKALHNKVRVTVQPQGFREPFKERLQELFSGLNVRNPTRENLATREALIPEREAQRPIEYLGETVYLIPRIPRYLDPIDLANAIRLEQVRSDVSESMLESDFGVDSDNMRRNIAGINPSLLFELETFDVRDLPIVELQVSNGEMGYRQLDELSVGQKCTALLSLVLLESAFPLVIDQPEDDLDNQFIFDQIVTTLRNEKERRQFIIATHNANIPVSGDAELIVVLRADEGHGWVSEDGIGSIDTVSIKRSVEQILEGGEVAFKIRKEKYSIRS